MHFPPYVPKSPKTNVLFPFHKVSLQRYQFSLLLYLPCLIDSISLLWLESMCLGKKKYIICVCDNLANNSCFGQKRSIVYVFVKIHLTILVWIRTLMDLDSNKIIVFYITLQVRSFSFWWSCLNIVIK